MLALLAFGSIAGCSNESSVDDPATSPPADPQVGVTVTPATATISTTQTQQFAATVANSSNSAVTWRVGGIVGGNAVTGVISADGLYTPPGSATTQVISAASVADPTRTGSSTITVQALPLAIKVTVTPANATISTIQTQQFTATVANSSNSAVTWRVGGIVGGNAATGLISADGLYTPPGSATTQVISAASVADPTRTGSSTITVQALPLAIKVTVAPANATISTIQTQQFTATVANSSNSAVTWRVGGIVGGNAVTGLISADGLYTPPGSATTQVISAASVADPTRTGSSTITVQLLPIAVTVTPASASISTIQTQQFTATVANSSNSEVTWQVNGVEGGNTSLGLITADGLYTPPGLVATYTVTATSVEDTTSKGSANVTVGLLSGVLTYHNDNTRTGQYLQETVLTPANVSTATFGKLYSFFVDGAVYAQPLYVANVPIAGQLHNVVFVATENNSVYAFDADNQSANPLWHTSFNDPGRDITPVPSPDTDCADITPIIGITSTPVIDPVTGTLYVVAMTKEKDNYAHRIHALDITTGKDVIGKGTKIKATVPGTAEPNDGKGNLVFTSLLENQRAALLLSDDALYFSFGSFCDLGDHHGWMLAYDSKTLVQLGAFSATPDGTEGGIWQSGGGAAADASGNIYAITGDGTFDADSGGNNYGSTFLKFNGASLIVVDYFTPFNQATLEAVNGDLGSGGALLLPDQSGEPEHLLVSAGKQGTIYLLDRDDMGGFQEGSDSQIVQSIQNRKSLFGTPAYFQDTVYIAANADRLNAWSLANGQLTLSSQSPNTFLWPGATAAISANGSGNGIVWALETNGSGALALLHAYSAADVSVELYNSNQNAARDFPGAAVKFTVPTIVDGKVFVGAQDRVSVFGLLP